MELALQKKLDNEHGKQQQEKQWRKEEHKKEEESRKQLEDAEREQQNAEATGAADGMMAQLVSPSNLNPKDTETEDADLNKNLF